MTTGLSQVPCCGVMHITMYCPHCGKQLSQPHDLLGLLEHCRKCQQTAENTLARSLRYVRGCQDKGDKPNAKMAKRVCGQERSVAKWTSWTNGLSELLQEKGVG
jgi:hypothetical protein